MSMASNEARSPHAPLSPRQLNVNNSTTLQESPQLVPSCQTISSTGKARLQCHACNRLLEYDAGAQYVQCFSCSTMNAVQAVTQVGGRVLSMLCAICHTTNLAPYGINYVRCGTCSTISQVSHAYRNDPITNIALSGPRQVGVSTVRQREEHIPHISSGNVPSITNNGQMATHNGLQDLSEA